MGPPYGQKTLWLMPWETSGLVGRLLLYVSLVQMEKASLVLSELPNYGGDKDFQRRPPA